MDSLIDLGETERTLLVVRECLVYKLPPRPGASGYRCQDWPKENWIFTGRCRVLATGDACTVRIEDPNSGELFAMCPLNNDHPETSVEPVVDSSRYFVVRVDDGHGRHAYLGMGFRDRTEAFEFNVALQDHVKHVKGAHLGDGAADSSSAPAEPLLDLSLKEGEKIHVNIGGRAAVRKQSADAAGSGGGLGALPPPPALSAPPGTGGARRRSTPQSGAPQPAAPPPAGGQFGDLLGGGGGGAAGQGQQQARSSDWVNFG